jgi:hypothetical protein
LNSAYPHFAAVRKPLALLFDEESLSEQVRYIQVEGGLRALLGLPLEFHYLGAVRERLTVARLVVTSAYLSYAARAMLPKTASNAKMITNTADGVFVMVCSRAVVLEEGRCLGRMALARTAPARCEVQSLV